MDLGSKLADYLRQGADTLTNLPTEAQRFITNPQAFTQLVTGKNPLLKETGFVAGATGLPVKNPVQGGVLNPASTPYQEGYEQGEPVAIASMALPAYATALRAGAPKAYNALENYMVKSGGMLPLEAYHGTPHKIQGQFDINKVGTGEGAQAYGHGMYFAENPLVAKEYQTALSNPEVVLKSGERISKPALGTGEDVAKAWLEEQFLQGSKNPFDDALAKITKLRNSANNPAQFDDAAKVLNNWKSQGATVDLGGNLYKVDIPDEYIPNMLDWDKPLSQQPNVIKQLKAIDPQELNKLGINSDFTRRSTGKELTGESLYDVLTTFNSQKGASKFLADKGITGIRYLDQGSRSVTGGELIEIIKTPQGYVSKIKIENRGGAGFSAPTQQFTSSVPYKTESEAKKWADEKINSGTSNFVVFDPTDVKILEENAKPIARKELIQQQIDKIE